LQFLLALDNNFSSEFPYTNANYKSLQRFRISQNHFTGKVPEGIWGLPFDTVIDISDNGLIGGIFSSVGISTSLTQLYAQNNNFSGETHRSWKIISRSPTYLIGCIPIQMEI